MAESIPGAIPRRDSLFNRDFVLLWRGDEASLVLATLQVVVCAGVIAVMRIVAMTRLRLADGARTHIADTLFHYRTDGHFILGTYSGGCFGRGMWLGEPSWGWPPAARHLNDPDGLDFSPMSEIAAVTSPPGTPTSGGVGDGPVGVQTRSRSRGLRTGLSRAHRAGR